MGARAGPGRKRCRYKGKMTHRDILQIRMSGPWTGRDVGEDAEIYSRRMEMGRGHKPGGEAGGADVA